MNFKSWRSTLKIHPAAALFPRMNVAELAALGEDIKKNGMHIPVILWQPESGPDAPVFLLDGINRLDGAEAVGMRVDEGFITDCSKLVVGGDPYELVISANIHRRHLTAEQKRDLIAKVLKATPAKSDRQIAEQVKASPSTVGKVRKELEHAGDVSNLDTRIDSKGREQPAHKPVAEKHHTVDSFLDDIVDCPMPVDTIADSIAPTDITEIDEEDEESASDARVLVHFLESVANNLLPRVRAWVETQSGTRYDAALYDILDGIHCETAALTLELIRNRSVAGAAMGEIEPAPSVQGALL